MMNEVIYNMNRDLSTQLACLSWMHKSYTLFILRAGFVCT